MSRAGARIPRNLPLAPRRKNDGLRPAHIAFVKHLPCLGCGAAGPCDPAHVRMSRAELGKFNAMSRKPDDKYTVPLCVKCHREAQHTKEGERSFWSRLGIDPLDLALRLWAITGDSEAGKRAVFRARQTILLRQETPGKGAA